MTTGTPGTHDHIEVTLPAGACVLVFSDLHLRQRPTPASRQIEDEVAGRLAQFDGPGAVVLNGDVVELWGEPEGTVDGALDAHPRLTAALQAFAQIPGRHVIVIVGNHDAALAWDNASAGAISRRLGGACTLIADLVFRTPSGVQKVRCEHGHAYDPANALRDPRNPLDSPLGQHIIQEVLPYLTTSRLLRDLDAMSDPNASGEFLGSRLLYRLIGPRLWWLLLPILLSLLLRAPLLVRALARSGDVRRIQFWLLISTAGVAVNVAGLILVISIMARRIYAVMASSRLGPRGAHSNGAPRAAAAALVAKGYAGLITAHTHHPELSAVPGGFYANSGCCQRAIEQRPARFGLPPVFLPVVRRSWIELDAEREIRVQLVLAESPTGEATRLERLAMTAPQAVLPRVPEVVAVLPGGAGWPLLCLDLDRRRSHERVRAGAAVAVSVVALLSLVSSLTLPLQGRLRDLLDVLPIEVPQTAAASVAFLSVALLVIALGLRRGHRMAWGIAAGLLASTAVLHLLKGLDVEESALATVMAIWLVRRRQAFPVRPEVRQWRVTIWTAAAGALVLAGSFGLVLVAGQKQDADLSARAMADLLLQDGIFAVPSALPFLTPALLAAAVGLLLAAGLLITRPHRQRATTGSQQRADLRRARQIVIDHGGDTLSYFALRDDKTWFFTNDCVIAYALKDGVCLVSPDPIGPPDQWAGAWADFTAFTDRHGWPVTVIGASAGWLPIYHAAGMRSMYMGDEAIVDCSAFTLEGRPMKGLRSAHHRVQRAGYEVRFFDPAMMETELAQQLTGLLSKSRRGQVERGFSMTLSRAFDPADTGMLLAVAFGPGGVPAGFCQWAPAADISGWSLDLMRRDADPDLPNGLIDFLIIETISHLKAQGQWGLSLNFAVMRAVLAGEMGNGILTDLQRRVLNRFSDTMQIASLWHYNEKFQPIWRPRYIALGRLTSAPSQSLAIADAEGVTELPLVGRFLGRGDPAEADTSRVPEPAR